MFTAWTIRDIANVAATRNEPRKPFRGQIEKINMYQMNSGEDKFFYPLCRDPPPTMPRSRMRIHMQDHVRTLGIGAEFICIAKTEAEANTLRRINKKRRGKRLTEFLKLTSQAREQGTLPNGIVTYDLRKL